MKTAYIDLIKFALAKGCTISVWDGEEWQVKKSTKQKTIVEAVKSVEEAQLRIRDAAGNMVFWARVSAYDLQPDETVIDWSDNPFGNEWIEQYETAVYGKPLI